MCARARQLVDSLVGSLATPTHHLVQSSQTLPLNCETTADFVKNYGDCGTSLSAPLAQASETFQPCTTDMYLHIDARMADYINTHP